MLVIVSVGVNTTRIYACVNIHEDVGDSTLHVRVNTQQTQPGACGLITGQTVHI